MACSHAPAPDANRGTWWFSQCFAYDYIDRVFADGFQQRAQRPCLAAGVVFAVSLILPDRVSLETSVIVGFSQLPVML